MLGVPSGHVCLGRRSFSRKNGLTLTILGVPRGHDLGLLPVPRRSSSPSHRTCSPWQCCGSTHLGCGPSTPYRESMLRRRARRDAYHARARRESFRRQRAGPHFSLDGSRRRGWREVMRPKRVLRCYAPGANDPQKCFTRANKVTIGHKFLYLPLTAELTPFPPSVAPPHHLTSSGHGERTAEGWRPPAAGAEFRAVASAASPPAAPGRRRAAPAGEGVSFARR